MTKNSQESFQGKYNKRLTTENKTNCECTAAWQNKETEYDVDEVNKPSLDCVIEAKDWVDNGSKL